MAENRPIPNDPFYVDRTVAEQFEFARHRAGHGGHFGAALDNFRAGLRRLGVPETFIEGEAEPQELTAWQLPLQASEGFRDLGFAKTRQALAAGVKTAPAYYGMAERRIECAKVVVVGVLDRVLLELAPVPKELTDLVMASRGLANSLRVRTDSARHFQLNEIAPGSSKDAAIIAGLELQLAQDQRQTDFQTAHKDLFERDGYGWVSNACVAWRDLLAAGVPRSDERIQGWQKHVADGLRWTKQYDPPNLQAARLTAFRHKLARRSRAAARAAILSPRRV